MYFFMRQTESQLNRILSKLETLETKMPSQKEIIEAARAEQNLIKAALDSIDANINEVKQLLANNDVAGAQELLDEIKANSEALVKATLENADLTAAVDAVNGEPAPAATETSVDTAAAVDIATDDAAQPV